MPEEKAPESSEALMVYEPFTAEQAEKEREAAQFDTLIGKWSEGRNRIRVVPALRGHVMALKVEQHWVHPPGETAGGIPFYCPLLMAKLPCEIHKEIRRLQGTGAQGDADRAKDLKSKNSWIINSVDRANQDKGPVPMPWSWHMYANEGGLLELRTDPDMGRDFTDPERGNDIIVTKFKNVKTGFMNYSVKLGPECPLGPPEKAAEWIKGQVDLRTLVHFATAEEMRAALDGESSAFPPREEKDGGDAQRVSGPGAAKPTEDDVKY